MKIAIMGSGNGSNFEAIATYLKDVEIVCISDVEDAYILERAKNLGIEAIYLPFDRTEEYFKENKFDLAVLAGYMRVLPPEVLALSRFINIHPSLLPSFKGKDAIKNAFLAGVKVSGVTIHWVEAEVDCGKIIAQYPILITNEMHFDEFEAEIHALEHKLYPRVVETILQDKVFEYYVRSHFTIHDKDSGNPCNGGCCGDGCGNGGCGGCH